MADETVSYVWQTARREEANRGQHTITHSVARWAQAASEFLQDGADLICHARRGDAVLHGFADYLRQTRAPSQVEQALVQVAGELAGADIVVLCRSNSPGREARPVAVWPEEEEQAAPGQPTACTLCVPVELGGRTWGTLQLSVRKRRRWPARLVRQLVSVGTMAAAAERAARSARGAGTATPFDPVTGLYNEPFLTALLDQALRQAQRRREPLSLLYISADSQGESLAAPRIEPLPDPAVQAMATAVTQTVRASDIVARLDNDDLVVVLPAAQALDAPTVALAICRAIAEAGFTTPTPFPLTASIGCAGFPDDAESAEGLLAVAAAAQAKARRQGGNRVERALGIERAQPVRIASCVG
jgi:diguanylate cyclase (GGDEF)-like protein